MGNFYAPITNPTSLMERRRLDFAILRAGQDSKSEGELAKLSTWFNYNFRAYYGGANAFRSVDPADFNSAKQHMKGHAIREKERFISKFGMDAEQLLEKTGIAQAVYDDAEGPGGALERLFEHYDNRPMTKDSTMTSLTELSEAVKGREATDKELRAFRENIMELADKYQKMLDVAAEIDASVGKKALSRMEGGLPVGAPSGTPRVVQFDRTTLTNTLNFQKRVDALESTVKKLEKNSASLESAGIVDGKIQAEGLVSGRDGSYSTKETWIQLSSYQRMVRGYLTNYIGGVFESGMVHAIAEASNEIISSVHQAGGETGTAKITLPEGGEIVSRTSKTDVVASGSFGKESSFDINISNKAQVLRGNTGSTKAYDGNLNTILRMVSNKEADYTTIQAAFISRSVRSTASSLNQFLGALMADYAIGGPSGDRIDFMAYRDTMMALYEYLPRVDRAIIQQSGSVASLESTYADAFQGFIDSGKSQSGYSFPQLNISARIMVKTEV